MPIHDWTKADTATFHAFHTAWITHLSEALNGGVLPSGYYALPEQHAGRHIADVLTLHAPGVGVRGSESIEGGVAVADAPPKTQRKMTASPSARSMRRTLAIRHVSGHQVVALVEILSPANKDRQAHIEEFVDKAESALLHDVHLTVIDLLPPARFDPQGIHAAIWERFDEEAYLLPPDQSLTLAAYTAGVRPIGYVEHLRAGATLTDMPLFLSADRYITLPLESTYMSAFRGLPGFVQDILRDSTTTV